MTLEKSTRGLRPSFFHDKANSNLFNHQLEASAQIASSLQASGFAALAGAPRSGKTATAIWSAYRMGYRRVLVFTPKAAIPGWDSEIARMGMGDSFDVFKVTNYEQAPKLDPNDYDFVILDESHRLGNRGKKTKRFTSVRRVAYRLPLLIMSGTMIIESPLAIYYQTAISQFGPFAHYPSFYKFFQDYGISNTMTIQGRTIEQYNRCKESLDECIAEFVVTMTQEDAGITGGAVDQVHVVKLKPETKALIKQVRDGVLEVQGREVLIESVISERLAVHQLEHGGIKAGDEYLDVKSDEVADYILSTFGDHNKLALMCHYISTRKVFERKFKNATLLSSNAHAEGVDLSGYSDFVVAGTDFSGAKHAQRRERGVNMMRQGNAVVHFIVTNGGISREVYKAVTSKKDFNLAQYRKWRGSL
jgi:hypothetical protein